VCSSDLRKTDKEILHHYKTILTSNINEISNGKYENLLKFSELPDLVRGYDDVRLATVDTYYKEADKLFKA
jgi:indolepyruvate ferredoxin oxidoreductase